MGSFLPAVALALVALSGCSSSSAAPGGSDAGSADATSADAAAPLTDSSFPGQFGSSDVAPLPLPPFVGQNGTFDVDSGVDGPGSCAGTEPTSGAPCTSPGAVCSYGSSTSFACRDLWTCTGGQWVGGAAQDGGACTYFDPLCSGAAPSDLPVCTGVIPACHFADGTMCGCAGPSPQSQWTCWRPTQDPGCPPIAPNVGAPCTSTARCEYGFVNAFCSHDSALVACIDGVWNGGPAQRCAD